jgi:hypothetical protein
MFQFPRFPQPTLFHSGRRDTPQQVPGFPIRTSTDQRSVDNSPWLIAVTHVLHRYQVPRHPPLAFHSLEEQRCSYSLCKSQTANHHHNQQQHHTRGHQHTPHPKTGTVPAAPRTPGTTPTGPLPQNRREDTRTHPDHPPGNQTASTSRQPDRQAPNEAPTRKLNPRKTRRHYELLRKEVIQPHLPVRLPCYDFTPIADPTFDSSLPKGLGHRLRVLPTFVV